MTNTTLVQGRVDQALKTDSQSSLADMIHHFLIGEADRLDVFRGYLFFWFQSSYRSIQQ